jgi:glycosidase
MGSLKSIDDTLVKAAVADARRRAALSDEELQRLGERRPFRSPEDWRDLPIYFLMLDRFSSATKLPATRWNGHAVGRQGGTPAGVTERLPYLRDLGMKALWLSPPVRNCAAGNMLTYHGYSAQNFLAIDERWSSDGTRDTAERELAILVEAAHDLGIYVILDIVLNHSGSVFAYNRGAGGNFDDQVLLDRSRGGGDLPTIMWKDGFGNPHPEWPDFIPAGAATGPDEAVYPIELRDSFFFRRRGSKTTDDLSRYPQLGFVPGDFGDMRQLCVEFEASDTEPSRRRFGKFPVLSLLLRIYQYLVARFDFDGLRIDTVKYIDPKFIQRFGTAMNEFAYSIGKKNFFIFGEVADNNANIASFVGRNGSAGSDDPEGGFGIDAALDFPLDQRIREVAKGPLEGRSGVNVLRDLFDERRKEEEELISTHGDASSYFVTFVDNHDRHERIRHPASPDAEVRLCLSLPYLLPGIPCLYYGDEQDLNGTTQADGSPDLESFESVREALWGKFQGAVFAPGTLWPQGGGTYQMLAALSALRARSGSIKYGRYYFRQVSGDGNNFGWSMEQGGVLAFSRIHADEETVVVCIPNPFLGFSGFVEIDPNLALDGDQWKVVFSSLGNGGSGVTRTFSQVPLRKAVNVSLASNEVLVLARA